MKIVLNQQINNFIPLRYAGNSPEGHLWLCLCCLCGGVKTVAAGYLKKYKSCGCLLRKNQEQRAGIAEYQARQKAKPVCKRGHPAEEEFVTSQGWRDCRLCKNERMRNYNLRTGRVYLPLARHRRAPESEQEKWEWLLQERGLGMGRGSSGLIYTDKLELKG